jgi:hypothetical protein
MKARILRFGILCIALSSSVTAWTQVQDTLKIQRDKLDSIYIVKVQDKHIKDKVLHAEPLYIDLIRDLGARKGEREWNVGLGLTDNKTFDEYQALIEYEWAPMDRLGLEVEFPFSFYFPTENGAISPKSRLNSFKCAGQYSFFVSEKLKTSMAIGYIHEFELTSFNNYGKSRFYIGNVFNPFFILAKRWGQNFHTLLYTGPQFYQSLTVPNVNMNWQINTNLHYMIDGTRNFIGIEFNKDVSNGKFDMTIRPQMRVSLTENLLIGIVTGINVSREEERFSSFLRLIYEPKHK